MKALMINGSPVKDGCIHTALAIAAEEFAAAASSARRCRWAIRPSVAVLPAHVLYTYGIMCVEGYVLAHRPTCD